MAGLQLYQKEIPALMKVKFSRNCRLEYTRVIFSEHVIGKFQKNTQKSIFEDPNAKNLQMLLTTSILTKPLTLY